MWLMAMVPIIFIFCPLGTIKRNISDWSASDRKTEESQRKIWISLIWNAHSLRTIVRQTPTVTSTVLRRRLLLSVLWPYENDCECVSISFELAGCSRMQSLTKNRFSASFLSLSCSLYLLSIVFVGVTVGDFCSNPKWKITQKWANEITYWGKETRKFQLNDEQTQ